MIAPNHFKFSFIKADFKGLINETIKDSQRLAFFKHN